MQTQQQALSASTQRLLAHHLTSPERITRAERVFKVKFLVDQDGQLIAVPLH